MISYNSINSLLELFHKNINEYYWRHLTEQKPFHISDFYEEATRLFSNRDVRVFINTCCGHTFSDKTEQRKWCLLQHYFSRQSILYAPELYSSIDKAYRAMTVTYSCEDHSSLTIQELVYGHRTAKDPEIKEFYSRQLETINRDFKQLIIEIVRKRNKISRYEGGCDYYEMYFAYGNDEKLFTEGVKRIKHELITKRNNLIFCKNPLFEQEIHEMFGTYFSKSDVYRYLEESLERIGYNCSTSPICVYDDSDNPKSHMSNECVAVQIPNDVRVYQHDKRSLMDYYYVVFHEYGHALHESSIECSDYIHKLTPVWYSESMAALLDKIVVMPEFLNMFVINPGERKNIRSLYTSTNYNIYLSNCIDFIFERFIYKNDNLSTDEYDAFYEKLVYDWTGLEKRKDWGQYLFLFAKYPFNNISYVLAHAYSNQIIENYIEHHDSYMTKELYGFLKHNFYCDGNMFSCSDVISRIFSKNFNWDYFFYEM